MALSDIDSTIAGLSKERKDWLEVFGNAWSPVKVMPGTCMACIWGEGGNAGYTHAVGCARVTWVDQAELQGQLDAYMNGQIEVK